MTKEKFIELLNNYNGARIALYAFKNEQESLPYEKQEEFYLKYTLRDFKDYVEEYLTYDEDTKQIHRKYNDDNLAIIRDIEAELKRRDSKK